MLDITPKLYMNIKILLVLILLALSSVLIAASYPSYSFETTGPESYQELQSDPFLEEQVAVNPNPLLGGAPILPPDPGVEEVPVGDFLPMYILILGFTIIKIRRRFNS